MLANPAATSTITMLDAKAVARMFTVSLRTVRHWDAAKGAGQAEGTP